jgi:formiminoglutamate deiminase
VTRWFAAHALLPDWVAADVAFDVVDGRFAAVTAGADPTGAIRLPGVVLPGFANAHSHAFHRGLRGRTQADGGTFWTWRERMYALAARLDPVSYLALARATYAEMPLAGITTVGEFHYLHHGADGAPYAEPNAMAEALREAAADAGVRLTLLDACYLAGGLGAEGPLPLAPAQRRFADRDVDAWAARVADLRESPGMRVGVAVHSVRATPRAAIKAVADLAAGRPVHVHLAEQRAEVEACRAAYGLTPAELLDAEGALGPMTTAVHATHLDPADVTRLGRSGVAACFCPTTERDLADGIGPARALRDAGTRLALGTDAHALIDPFEEARALEMHERIVTGERGRFAPADLLAALTEHGCLGWPDAGLLAPGYRADLVAVRTDTVRTAGAAPDQLPYVASAADVQTVVVDGRVVVEDGRHRLGTVGALLSAAIDPLWAAT